MEGHYFVEEDHFVEGHHFVEEHRADGQGEYPSEEGDPCVAAAFLGDLGMAPFVPGLVGDLLTWGLGRNPLKRHLAI